MVGAGDTRQLSALSISRSVHSHLGCNATVLAVFDRACQLRTATGHVVALVLPPIGDGPLNIVVEAAPGVFAALAPGQPAQLGGSSVQVGHLQVGLAGARTWDPRPDWSVLRTSRRAVESLLAPLGDLALTHASPDSLLALLPRAGPLAQSSRGAGIGQPHLGSGSERRHPEPVDGICASAPLQGHGASAGQEGGATRQVRLDGAALGAESGSRSLTGTARAVARQAAVALKQGWAGEESLLPAAAARLAGLGGGLTPAGDDFLVGAMLWGWLARPHPQRFCTVLAETAVPRTTVLSAAFLQAAARGECSHVWHRLLQVLAAGQHLQLAAAVTGILAHGQTSGADALAGFLWLASA
ncbi:MAG: DUF2877 domain-containing protein [Anaerolineae bacterium]